MGGKKIYISDDCYYALVPRLLFMVNKFNGEKSLWMGARVLLGFLLSYRNLPVIYLSQETMGKKIGVSRQTISKYLKELKEAGLITSSRTKTTCQIYFTPYVKNMIKHCQDTLTQVSNKRNEVKKVYKTSNSKKIYKNTTLKEQLRLIE